MKTVTSDHALPDAVIAELEWNPATASASL
jgi:hypothetical protein